MTDALKVVPTEDRVTTGVRDVGPISEGLADVLADTYCLTFKTHGVHWNVEGPMFYSVHKMTEQHYEDMFTAADDMAERIRALGRLAPQSIAEIVKRTVIEDAPEAQTAGDMCHVLAEDHMRLAKRMHALIDLAGARNDAVTEDLATRRSAFHEEAAWMLRSLARA